MAESYKSLKLIRDYIFKGKKWDYLYDKVEFLWTSLKHIIAGHGWTDHMPCSSKRNSWILEPNRNAFIFWRTTMEQRIASPEFLGNADLKAKAAGIGGFRYQ